MRSVASRVIEVALNNSLLLVVGAVSAVIWANVDLPGYNGFIKTLYFPVDDIGMVFFFALATRKCTRRRCRADRWRLQSSPLCRSWPRREE